MFSYKKILYYQSATTCTRDVTSRNIIIYFQIFTGALNRYRNVDRDWEDLAAWDGEPLRVPTLFIGGSLDDTTTWMAEAVAAHPDKRILDGCGHWIQQQRPDEVNALLIEWLARS